MSGASESRFSAATLDWIDQVATQGIFTTDRDLRVRTWNRWIEQYSGRAAADVIGRPLLEVLPELVSRRVDGHYRAALTGEPRVLAHTFHKYLVAAPAGAPEPAQSARIAPLASDGEIIGTITVIEDVSERVARERELRHQIETAEFARAVAEEAVRTKDEFLATLSHEIRTPLNAVVGWTKILQSRDADPALLKRALEVIERNAMAQMHLIDDMLDMARIMTGKLRLEVQPVDAVEILQAAIDVIAPAARAKGLNLEASLASDGPSLVAADPDRLQQVIWNLLSNAIKFTEAGGLIQTGLAQEDDMVRIWVSDNGSGIDEAFMPHMFERFRQAHGSSSRRHGGLGLGLPLVKQLVELHGGTVAATSLLGKGSTFTVTLPLLREAAAGAAAVPETLSDARILVMDEQEDARELTRTALQHYGIDVAEAESSAQALAAIDSAIAAHLPFEAVLASVGLSDNDGYELVSRLRERPPSRGGETPVVALTPYALPRDRQRALAAGFREHMVKPLDPAALLKTLKTIISASRRRNRRAR
jgi:PAS domain S-box-containing protein